MIKLTRLYLKAHLYRDLAILAAFTAVSILLSLWSFSKAQYAQVPWWIFGCTAYTFATSLRNCFDSEQCVSPILLPASEQSKFGFTLIRTLFIFPLLSFLAILITLYPISNEAFHNFIPHLLHTRLPLYHLPVAPYFMVWFCSLALLAATFPPRLKAAATVTAILVATASIFQLDVAGESSYPFIDRNIDLWSKGVEWKSVYSWTGLPVKIRYVISYLWLCMLPAAAIAISYFRFKEINFRRWN